VVRLEVQSGDTRNSVLSMCYQQQMIRRHWYLTFIGRRLNDENKSLSTIAFGVGFINRPISDHYSIANHYRPPVASKIEQISDSCKRR
jgi:hypothetical protein